MRPHLHPSMGIVPIAARVAIQLTSIEYARNGKNPAHAGVYSRLALRVLPLGVDPMLRLALHSLSVYIDMGWTGREWLQCVLDASHYGSSFRRCFFFEYKANRSPYPRVTNRGVQDSVESFLSPIVEVSRDA